jgi:hypothetical protein
MHINAFGNKEHTSMIAGNSVEELDSSYNEPVPEDIAFEYWDIMPPVESTAKGAAQTVVAHCTI